MKLKDFLKKEIRAILQEEEGAPAAGDDAPPPVKGKTRLKTRGRGYGKCPEVAGKIQAAAAEVIDSFEPEEEQDDKALDRLKSRLNDKKLGNTTLGVVNTYISAIGKQPFPYNQKGYNEACKLTENEINNLITAMKKQPEKLVSVAATTPQPTPPPATAPATPAVTPGPAVGASTGRLMSGSGTSSEDPLVFPTSRAAEVWAEQKANKRNDQSGEQSLYIKTQGGRIGILTFTGKKYEITEMPKNPLEESKKLRAMVLQEILKTLK